MSSKPAEPFDREKAAAAVEAYWVADSIARQTDAADDMAQQLAAAVSRPQCRVRFTVQVTAYGDTPDEVEIAAIIQARELTAFPGELDITSSYTLVPIPPPERLEAPFLAEHRCKANGKRLRATVHVNGYQDAES
jgi:hypothetical protein